MVNNRIFQFEYRETLCYILCLVLSILMLGAQLSWRDRAKLPHVGDDDSHLLDDEQPKMKELIS